MLIAVLALAVLSTRAVRAQTLPTNGHLVAVNGVQLYYETSGNGPPLVLLHNFAGSGAMWTPFVPELAKGYKVIVIDLRGHGRSTNPSGQFTHRQAALDIFGLLDHLGIRQFKAIGVSSGAMTLIQMATQQPSRVQAMVLVGGSDQFTPEIRAILRDPACEHLSPADWQRMRGLHKHGDAQIVALQHEFCGFKYSYDDMNFTPPLLSSITAHTLIVHGDHDRYFPPRIALEMYTAIPHAFLWIVPNGTHLPLLSPTVQPEFLRTTVEFLRGDWDKTH